jgi:hypothetical protein
LIEDDGDGEEEARVKGHFEKGKEGLWNGKGNQSILKVGLEVSQQCLGEGVQDDAQQDDHDHHLEQAFPQIAQRLEDLFSIHPGSKFKVRGKTIQIQPSSSSFALNGRVDPNKEDHCWLQCNIKDHLLKEYHSFQT